MIDEGNKGPKKEGAVKTCTNDDVSLIACYQMGKNTGKLQACHVSIQYVWTDQHT